MTTTFPSKKGGKTPRKPLCKSHKVWVHVLAGKSITGKQAMDQFGVYRLSSIISDMRKAGHDIVTTLETYKGSTFARYKLKKPPLVP